VGPLPQPSNWSYVPLSAQMDTAGWLQRPYALPEATRCGCSSSVMQLDDAPGMKRYTLFLLWPN
jgi:hypothetical protein